MVARAAVAVLCVIVIGLPWIALWTGWPVFDALDTLLGWQCHRLEDRTWNLAGVPMAVCSRCAGIYAGVALGAAWAWPRWPVRRTVVVSLCALALLVVEAALEDFGWLPPMHPIRTLTGMALAWPIAAAAVAVLASPRGATRMRPAGPRSQA